MSLRRKIDGYIKSSTLALIANTDVVVQHGHGNPIIVEVKVARVVWVIALVGICIATHGPLLCHHVHSA